MKSQTVFVLLTTLLFSSLATARDYYSQNILGTVQSIEVNNQFTSSRNIIVRLGDTNHTIKLCDTGSSHSESGYINKSDHPDTFGIMLSLLLAAKTTQRNVSVLTADGAEGCRIDRVQIH